MPAATTMMTMTTEKDTVGRTRARPGRTAPRWQRARTVAASSLGALLLLAAPVGPVAAQGYAELSRDREMRLAMSAGPLSVSRDADVWVLGERGFEKAVEGSNGFACMVIRSAVNKEVLAPHCFSPDAVKSVVPAKLAEGRLQMAGRSQEEIDRELEAGFENGTLPLPSGHAYAYMLSEGQKLGPAGKWLPHFMLYMPYATNDDLSADPDNPVFPFVGPEVGHAHSTMVIVMREFVDPADVVLPR